MTLSEFELYMNEVDNRVDQSNYTCIRLFFYKKENASLKSIKLFEEYFKPERTLWNIDIHGYWGCPIDNPHSNNERITALLLFEQLCLSEKYYLLW